MRIQHNIMAMNAYRNYNTNTSALSKNLEKLSSGYKINRAGDDAAGLAISEKMRAQITGLNAAQKNVKDGISLVKTAEGAMQEIQDMLNRMDYLATQSANGTYDNAVDRLNLQKEVDALKSEINRIADSANFNGIKLLDGKAGVNTTAFTKFENVDGVLGHDGTVNIPAASWGASGTAAHTEGAAAKQVNAEAVIDLSGITINAKGTTAPGDDVTAKITLGSTAYNITLTGKASYTVDDISDALIAAIQKDATGVKTADATHDGTTTTNNDGVKIGNNVYKLNKVAGEGVKLTLAGVDTAGTYKALATTAPTDATNEFNSTTATQINSDLGFTVTLSNVTNSTGQSGDAVHLTTKVVQAVAHVDSSLAGIDLKLDSSIVKNGNILEIDGKKFQFKTSADGFTADANAKTIDLTAEEEANWIHAAADKLSQEAEFAGTEGREWKIGSKGTDTIHFEQVKKSNTGSELENIADVKAKIKVTGTPTNDKGAGVAITVDPTQVAAGNTLKFGEGDSAVTLEVVESGADASKHQINKADITDKAKLQAALGSAYEVDVKNGTGNDADKKVITVYTALSSKGDQAAIDASKSPIVSGTGLKLQIGDTSDSYNQLDVKIGDMHTAALGIDKLDIGNPEGAAAAIQTVRDAINQVSSVRGDLGAVQNRLEHTANNLSVMAENIQDAESTIRDTDVAEEMMAYTKNNILIQSAQAMLAQANAVPQGVLQLLG